MFVVMTGLAAAGKSTLAHQLGAVLSLPVFDKDDVLEATFPDGPIDRDERVRLSRAADVPFRAAAEAAGDAVLVSFWRPPGLDRPAGTPIDWLRGHDVVEVYCRCDPEVAIDRFLARERHPAHGDDRWTREQGLANFRRLAALGPYRLGHVVIVDTDVEVDVTMVAEQIAGAVS